MLRSFGALPLRAHRTGRACRRWRIRPTSAEWPGKDVLANGSEKLGKLEDVYYDAETHEPLCLCVTTGRLSHKQVLVSVKDVGASPGHLTMAWSKDHLAGAPTTKPGAELTSDEEERVFRHYGLDYHAPASASGRRLVRR